eukprot:jgi/Bigna1/70398/fgenesh1_pg.12_\
MAATGTNKYLLLQTKTTFRADTMDFEWFQGNVNGKIRHGACIQLGNLLPARWRPTGGSTAAKPLFVESGWPGKTEYRANIAKYVGIPLNSTQEHRRKSHRHHQHKNNNGIDFERCVEGEAGLDAASNVDPVEKSTMTNVDPVEKSTMTRGISHSKGKKKVISLSQKLRGASAMAADVHKIELDALNQRLAMQRQRSLEEYAERLIISKEKRRLAIAKAQKRVIIERRKENKPRRSAARSRRPRGDYYVLKGVSEYDHQFKNPEIVAKKWLKYPDVKPLCPSTCLLGRN